MSSTVSARRPPATAWLTATSVAAVGYLAVWIIGLSIWPSNLSVTSSGNAVIQAFAGHSGVAITQYILTEGLAGVALAIVLGRTLSGLPRITGYCAAAVSVVQCGLGIYLAGSVVPGGDASSARTFFDLIDRLDGVKMALLAITAVVASIAMRRPVWLRYAGFVLAVAIAVSGIGYLLANTTLAVAAWISLPLLLIWVAGLGITPRRA
jgi:hypothetical protein